MGFDGERPQQFEQPHPIDRAGRAGYADDQSGDCLRLRHRATYLEWQSAPIIAVPVGASGRSNAAGGRITGGHRPEEALRMSSQDRIEALRERHAELERAIDEENKHPFPNQDAISDLKRQKLRIKDELVHLARQ
jgi:hypothetical protein